MERFSRVQAIRHGLLVGWWVVACHWAYLCVTEIVDNGAVGFDAHAYWNALQHFDAPYEGRPGERDAFNYTPAFLFLLSPLGSLEWQWFFALWFGLSAAAFIWLLRPVGIALGVPLFSLLCLRELLLGNVFALMAVSLVVLVTSQSAVGRGSAFGFLLLTKLSPVVVALWLPVTGQGRALAKAVVATTTVTAASYLAFPGLWSAWAGWLLAAEDGAELGLYVRLLCAVLLVALSGRLRRPELLSVAMVLSLPWIGGSSVLAVLAAWPRLSARGRQIRGRSRYRRTSSPAPVAVPPSRR